MEMIGDYILRNRLHALSIALMLACLPLLNACALIILVLVTLRKGEQEGLLVLLATLLPVVLTYFFVRADLLLIIISGLSNILLWVLACQLYRTNSWAWLLQVSTGIGLAFVIAVHIFNPEISLWWEQRLIVYLQQAKTIFANIQLEQLMNFTKRAAQLATGTQVAIAVITSLFCLLAGRCWQAKLFNPGQLQPELHNIRLAQSLALGLVIILVAALLTHAMVLVDLVPIVILPFVAAGLSLVHYFMKAKKIAVVWLGLFYILMALLFFYAIAILIVLGLLDSFMNFRAKITIKL